MRAESSSRDGEWQAAADVLRRRGYLGGEPGLHRSRRRIARQAAELIIGTLLLTLAAGLAGTGPPTPLALVLTALLAAPPVMALLLLVILGANWVLERLHRSGLSANRAVLGGAVVAALAAGGVWLWLTASSPVPRWHPLRIIGAALALMAAAGLSRLAGHGLAARLLRHTPSLRLALPRAIWTFGAAAVLVLLGLVLPQRPATTPLQAEPLRVHPRLGHVAVIGVDGLPLDDLRLVSREAQLGPARWGWAPVPDRGTEESIPVAWVTVATGVRPEVHGVTSVRQLRLTPHGPEVLAAPGLRAVLLLWHGIVDERAVPSAQRRVPAIWEMVSHAGMGVRVTGWWGSFPPRRVSGLVASERWLFTGVAEPGTVFPEQAAVALPEIPGRTPLAMDRRAAAVLRSSDPRADSLVMGYFPGWWLAWRRPHGGPISTAEVLTPHVELVARTADELHRAGWAVWIVSLHGGDEGWVLSSSASGRHEEIGDRDLASTWLDQLGLPIPAGAPAPRRDLSGVDAAVRVARAEYGPPPPLAGGTEGGEGTAQLELLRSLGYLR